MARKYTLKTGEHIRGVAQRLGFASLDPFEDEPDNAGVIAARGGVDKIQGGDRITVPEGVAGKKLVATGEHHEFEIPFALHTLEVRLYSEFRLPDPDHPGDKSRAPNRCKFFGHGTGNSGFFQIDAKVELMTMDPATGEFSATYSTETRVRTRDGGLTDLLAASICELPAPDTGTSAFLRIAPVRPEETSSGPAAANPGVDHGMDSVGSWHPANRQFHHEYRPLEIDFTQFNRSIFSAEVHGDPAPNRPHHATLFWKNVGERWGRMIIEVDWRPDFLRRVRGSVKPKTKKRIRPIDMVVVHHTGGPEMGAQLNTFLNKAKGAHFVLDLDGHVVRLADDKYNSKHGGGAMNRRMPNWGGRADVNHRAVGIENCHGDADHLDIAKNPYREAQYTALADLLLSLRNAYGISPRDVVGHHDVSVAHPRCPGPHLAWERLEEAGAALGPADLTPDEEAAMFGGFYAGADGAGRRIEMGDTQKGGPAEFRLSKGGGVEVGSLAAGPITELRAVLEHIGYDPDRKFSDHPISKTVFEGVTAFCVCQFIKHYCTGSRIRTDLALAYRVSPEIPNDLFIDRELARLLKRVEKAARSF